MKTERRIEIAKELLKQIRAGVLKEYGSDGLCLILIDICAFKEEDENIVIADLWKIRKQEAHHLPTGDTTWAENFRHNRDTGHFCYWYKPGQAAPRIRLLKTYLKELEKRTLL